MMIKAITDITIILYLYKKLTSDIELIDLNNYIALLNSPTTCIKTRLCIQYPILLMVKLHNSDYIII